MGAKALAVQGQIMKGFMTVLRYLRNPKGTTKPLNSLNQKTFFTRFAFQKDHADCYMENVL